MLSAIKIMILKMLEMTLNVLSSDEERDNESDC